MDDDAGLRLVTSALAAVERAESRLEAAVAKARNNGRSWDDIAMILGISDWMAQSRYGRD